MIMIKTWQQTLQCELLLASACKVEIENDDDAIWENIHDYDDDSGDYEIIYIGYDDDDNDEELPDGGDPPCPHSNGSLIAHDSDLKLFCVLLRYRL